MYSEVITEIEDLAIVQSFIEDCPRGLLLSVEWEKIHDLYTPFVYSDGKLIGYIHKSNPQWKAWRIGNRVKIIFNDPFSHIHSEWNYKALSVSGCIEMIEQENKARKYLATLMGVVKGCDESDGQNPDDDRLIDLLSEFIVYSVSIDSKESSIELKQSKVDESILDHGSVDYQSLPV